MSPASQAQEQPWILLLGNQILAIEPQSGALRWKYESVGWSPRGDSAGRMLLSGDNVIVAVARRLTCLDRATGRVVGEMMLPFDPDTAIADNGLLLFVALNEAICLTETGQLIWQILTDHSNNTCHTAHGQALWNMPSVTQIVGLRAGAIAGRQVSQPDLARS